MKNLLLFCVTIFFCTCREAEIKPQECVQVIELGVPFKARANCTYRLNNNGTEIGLKVKQILDNRAFGGLCAVSQGGNANVEVTINTADSFFFNWRGCDGTQEYNVNNPNLPSFSAAGVTIKMMKLYPLSETVENAPESVNDYEVKLVVLQ